MHVLAAAIACTVVLATAVVVTAAAIADRVPAAIVNPDNDNRDNNDDPKRLIALKDSRSAVVATVVRVAAHTHRSDYLLKRFLSP